MPSVRLNETRIKTLKPGTSAYDVRDATVKGFGVRVRPSGAMHYFIHTQHQGRRIWKTLGKTDAVNLDEARLRATAVLATLRQGADAPVPPDQTLFEVVAEEVFRRYARNWKPRTRMVNRNYFANHILPWFRGRQIGDITRRDVQEWFASLHPTPVSADRSAPILSVIMRQAEVYGYRPEESNPCKGIKRYQRKGRERILSAREIGRLAAVLALHESARPLDVAVIRLLLLTGCRKSEVLALEWTDYREGKLFLRDSKTGPRTVWLSCAARDVLDRLPRRTRWVFPSPGAKRRVNLQSVDKFWWQARAEAGLNDFRLHDLRHTYASIALVHGETVATIGKLLGHNQPETTLKYIHFADSVVHEASETIGGVLGAD